MMGEHGETKHCWKLNQSNVIDSKISLIYLQQWETKVTNTMDNSNFVRTLYNSFEIFEVFTIGCGISREKNLRTVF